MKRQDLKQITFIASFLTLACGTELKVESSDAGLVICEPTINTACKIAQNTSFNITTLPGITNKEVITVSWSEAEGAHTYLLGLSSESSCKTQAMIRQVKASQYDFATLGDGKYYICITALFGADHELTAENNGLEFIVDRTDPITAGEPNVTTASGGQSQIEVLVEDNGELSFDWSQIAGPGIVTFTSTTTQVTNFYADKTGTYTIQVVVTDTADNQKTMTHTFDYNSEL